MEHLTYIPDTFVENNTIFPDLISEIKKAFMSDEILIPLRHHHDFPNLEMRASSTLLLMPAWHPNKSAGIKVVTISPENSQFELPSVQGTYIYIDAKTGVLKAVLDAKELTAKRTAATSALASSFLSRKDASSLLMIGTGTLSKNLIKAHASVRAINQVYVWGRNFEKAQQIALDLKQETFTTTPIKDIADRVSEVDIISCATLSQTPLVLGKYIQTGQHIDLVGAYRPDMREADDEAIKKAIVFVDSMEGGRKESGDIVIPLKNGVITENDIKGDLFDLCKDNVSGRMNENEITLFKSVGHAIEDLAAANYYFNQYTDE